MAGINGSITSVAVMLDSAPELVQRLAINEVPVTFVGSERIDGPLGEWALAQRIALMSN